ncbi:MAG: acetoin utilization protein AcuC [Chloroflexi bacterium]|nr:acetoin utilization protein AcuC [Chloroflexota bacterium]
MKRAAFIYDDALSRHILRENHVLVPSRLRYAYELLEAYGAFNEPGSILVPPRPATDEEVLTFHTPAYLQAVKSLSRGESIYDPEVYNFSEEGDNPPFKGMYEASALSAGASLVAAEIVADGKVDVAFNAAGGLHHAAPGYASGFCIFNDPVIAIKHLLKRGFIVAYVDIDAHHGDGVQDAFYDTKAVLTISLHESGMFLFPGTGRVSEVGVGEGKGYSVNVPLAPYTDDEVYLWAFGEVVPPLIRSFNPDVLVTQLGIDTHFLDPITHLRLSTTGYIQVVRGLSQLSSRWVALGGGGYDAGVVARGWTLAYGIMIGKDWPDEIPEDYQQRYGLKKLRDAETLAVDERQREQARRFAEQSVSDIRRAIFPLHGL